MKLLNIGLVGALGSLGVIASSMAAQALDFNFSFTTDTGTNPGTTTGIIKGLTTGSNSVFSVLIDQNTVGITPGTELPRIDGNIIVSENEDISSISGVYFGTTNYLLDMNRSITTPSGIIYSNRIRNFSTGQLARINSTTPFSVESYSFTPVAATAVPFNFNPTEGAALGVPLFIGLRLLSKKKLAHKSAAIKTTETIS